MRPEAYTVHPESSAWNPPP